MWGDSYHHTLIAQLLVDHGGLFRSWEPYVPLRSFTYHFGFHSNVALFHWLTGVSVLKSVIVVGQIFNALAPLMIYPLVCRLGGTSWAGLMAVLIAGLLSPTPSSYVNWGRYTQLTGMTVLPIAATLAFGVIGNPTPLRSRSDDFNRMGCLQRLKPVLSSAEGSLLRSRGWRRLSAASVCVAGLVLSHYLVTLLFLSLMLAYLVWWTAAHIREAKANPLTLARPWLMVATMGLIAGVFTLPWILNLQSGLLPRVIAGRFGGASQTGYFQTEYNTVGDIFAHVPAWLIAVAVAGGLWGCWKRHPLAIITSVWTTLLILTANPNVIGLPGTGIVNNFTMLIALYLPLSILAGFGLAQMVQWATTRLRYARLLATGLIIIASLAGARLRLMDLDYDYRLVTPADLEAMAWIRDHTPADAKFLVNAFAAFGGNTVVGDDAGWWIPYLAGRRNTVPPATYGLEIPLDPAYPAQISAFYREITAQPLDSPAAVQTLHAHNITHIYIGAVGGELLDPTVLLNSPFYHLVYDHEGAMIFEVGSK
jgi:hypothetical protein